MKEPLRASFHQRILTSTLLAQGVKGVRAFVFKYVKSVLIQFSKYLVKALTSPRTALAELRDWVTTMVPAPVRRFLASIWLALKPWVFGLIRVK